MPYIFKCPVYFRLEHKKNKERDYSFTGCFSELRNNKYIKDIPQMDTDVEFICRFAHYNSLERKVVYKLLPD